MCLVWRPACAGWYLLQHVVKLTWLVVASCVPLQDIKFNVHAHPTISEVLDELFKQVRDHMCYDSWVTFESVPHRSARISAARLCCKAGEEYGVCVTCYVHTGTHGDTNQDARELQATGQVGRCLRELAR